MNNIWPTEHDVLATSDIDEAYKKSIHSFERLLAELAINKKFSCYLKTFYIPFAAWLRQKRLHTNDTLVVGINGAQGSGKSTMSLLLADVLQQAFRLTSVIISIDDIYKTRQQRGQMANDIHPLFKTRGVPGTHDIALGIECIQRIKTLKSGQILSYPRFDKANDERLLDYEWPQCQGPVDILIFEGWCVGAHPQTEEELIHDVNSLEKTDDADLIWRQAVNKHLQSDYKELFSLLDYLVFLQIPDFGCILEWRGLQEQKLANKHQHKQHLMTSQTALKRFIAHYERLTRHQLKHMPNIANLVIKLGRDHQIKQVSIRNP